MDSYARPHAQNNPNIVILYERRYLRLMDGRARKQNSTYFRGGNDETKKITLAILSILCSSLLLGTTAALAAPSSVTIFEAQLNSAQTLLTITSRSFTKRNHASLETDNITSLCSLGNTTGTPITCMFVLPDFPFGLPPGEYRILVLDPGAGVSDVFD